MQKKWRKRLDSYDWNAGYKAAPCFQPMLFHYVQSECSQNKKYNDNLLLCA